MMENTKKEPDSEIDTTSTSMDIQSLNNLVVSLRGLMKKVQLFTIQELVRQSKKLRIKRGSTVNLKKEKKAERLVLEVGAIKELKVDQAIKYALANTKTFEEVAAKEDLQTRAKVRLSTHPMMVKKVEKWRSEHEDWKALAAFIMYKNTGRRYKKKKKDKNKVAGDRISEKQCESKNTIDANESVVSQGKRMNEEKRKKEMVPIEKFGGGESAKELARKALMIEKRGNLSKLSHFSLGEDKDMQTKNDSEMVSPKDSKTSSEEEQSKSESEAQSDMSEDDLVKEIHLLDNNDSTREEIRDDNEQEETPCQESYENCDYANSNEGNSKSDHEKTSEDVKIPSQSKKDVISISPKRTDSKSLYPKNNHPSVSHSASKEMTIKKIDLKSLSEGTEDIHIEPQSETNVSLLFGAVQEAGKEKKKKDPFFAMSDESNTLSDDDDSDHDGSASFKDGPNDDDVAMEERFTYKRTDSAFIERLSDKQERGDWGINKNRFTRDDAGRGRFQKASQGAMYPVKNVYRGNTLVDSEQNHRGCDGFGFSTDTGQKGYPGRGRRNYSDVSRGASQQYKAPSKDHIDAQKEKLHPSWEAKRKRKELENKIADFQGKKIKFCD